MSRSLTLTQGHQAPLRRMKAMMLFDDCTMQAGLVQCCLHTSHQQMGQMEQMSV